MSDIFNIAVKNVLHHEGGFINDTVDPGGATNFGVSLRTLTAKGMIDLDGDGFNDFDYDRDGDVDAADIEAMSREQAIEFYRRYFWDKHGYGTIGGAVSIKLMDLSVNMGPRQSHKLLQRGLRSVGRIPNVIDDGILGSITRQAVSFTDDRELVIALRSEAAGFYRSLVAAKPKFEKYRYGWLNRAYA